MKPKFLWLVAGAVLSLAILIAVVFQPTKAPSRSDGEYAVVLAAMKPLLREIEKNRSAKGMASIDAVSAVQKGEIINASDGLLTDFQVSNEGAVLLQIKSSVPKGDIRIRLIPDNRASTGWRCEGLSQGELPSQCKRVVAR